MKRTWDESNSPQWRYLLGKESERKKEESKRKLFTGEGEIKRNKPGAKRNRIRSASPPPLGVTKAGKEIVYSASPGPPLALQQQLTTELHDILRKKTEESLTTTDSE